MFFDDVEAESPEGVDLIDFNDYGKIRSNILNNVKKSMGKVFPQTYGGIRLEVDDLGYDNEDPVSLAEQKKALLHNKYLTKKLRGTVSLFDDKSGDLLEKKRLSLMRVPWLTNRGTFIHGGNEYSTIYQSRLLPGVYTRRQSNGHLETQFNLKTGTGSGFRVGFEPETAQYRVKISQANLHMYSLLHDIGVPDEDLKSRWGEEVFNANKNKYDSRVLDKAYERLVPKRFRKDDEGITRDQKIEAIKSAFDQFKISKYVASRNLPSMFGQKAASEQRAKWVGREAMQKMAAARATDSVPTSKFVRIHVKDGDKRLAHHFLRADTWGPPSGKIDEGETPQQAAVRELLERTGLEALEEHLTPIGEKDGFYDFEVDYNNLNEVAAPGELGGYSTETRWDETAPTKEAAVTDHADMWDTRKKKFRLVDVGKLIQATSGRESESLPIASIWGGGEDESKGFSEERLEKTDTKHPILVDEYTEGEGKTVGLVDGRHRKIKLLRAGETLANIIRLTQDDLDFAAVDKEKEASPLKDLLQAKDHSDKKEYAAKHNKMALMMYQNPESFEIDSDDGKFVGITHRDTGFRMHLPRNIIPAAIMKGHIEKQAAELDFTPDFTPDELKDVYNAIYGKVGPQLASMDKWPDEWINKEVDPMGWLAWYEQYHAGRRTDDDDRQIKRWKQFKARHGSQLKSNPTPRRAFALRNWAIDPLSLLEDEDQKSELQKSMDAYKAKAQEDYDKKHV